MHRYLKHYNSKGLVVVNRRLPIFGSAPKWLRWRALKGQLHLVSLLYSIPFLILLIFLGKMRPDWAIALALGSLTGIGIWMSPFLKKKRKELQLPVSMEAARRIALSTEPSESQGAFLALSESKLSADRMVAIEGLKFIGTKTAYERIIQLGQDTDEQVSQLAKKTIIALDGPLSGKQLLSVKPMKTYMEWHEYWFKRTKKGNVFDPSLNVGGPLEKLEESVKALDEIVLSQMPLWRAYPDIFCMECYARTEQQHYLDWKWVRCKVCLDVHHVRNGVDRVLGEIGGAGTERMEGRTLIVPLWNEAQKQAMAVEADEITLLPEANINLDWAIAAVVGKIQDRQASQKWNLKVSCHPDLKLEANSLALLQSLDPAFGLDQASHVLPS